MCARGSNRARVPGPSTSPLEGMDRVATFDACGYAIEPSVLSDAEWAHLDAAVRSVDLQGAGTRELLNFEWAQRLARQLRDAPSISGLLGTSRIAIQCTYFAKVASRNWLDMIACAEGA